MDAPEFRRIFDDQRTEFDVGSVSMAFTVEDGAPKLKPALKPERVLDRPNYADAADRAGENPDRPRVPIFPAESAN